MSGQVKSDFEVDCSDLKSCQSLLIFFHEEIIGAFLVPVQGLQLKKKTLKPRPGRGGLFMAPS